jgi:hypothetical protein
MTVHQRTTAAAAQPQYAEAPGAPQKGQIAGGQQVSQCRADGFLDNCCVNTVLLPFQCAAMAIMAVFSSVSSKKES